MKKILTLVAALSLVASLAVGGSIAWLSDTDGTANVMTVGRVTIEQNEQDRNGKAFKQGQQILPIVGSTTEKDNNGYVAASNYIDKIVTVKNTGNADAWVRTLIAIPQFTYDGQEGANASANVMHWNGYSQGDSADTGYPIATRIPGTTTNVENKWFWGKKDGAAWPGNGGEWNSYDVTINGINHEVYIITHLAKLEDGATTAPNLTGLYLDERVDYDNDNGYYTLDGKKIVGMNDDVKVLVLSQAVQAGGFDTAWDAFDAAFALGDKPEDTIAEWFNAIEMPSVWTGEEDTSWYKRNTSATEFTLSTAEDLAGLAKLVNDEAVDFTGKTIKLTSNVDMGGNTWAPIGTLDNVFAGTFDGQGYTISNLTLEDNTADEYGLFGVAYNAEIKGINMKNVDISGNQDVAALIGYAYKNVNISDCHISGKINIVANYAYAGGIVGLIEENANVTIKNCSVIAEGTGVIKANEKNGVGGIAAWSRKGTSIENCQVKNLELTAPKSVGSFSGYLGQGGVIDGCVAENIILNKTHAESNPTIGLAVGGYTYKESNPITLKNNTFNQITLNNATTKEYAFEGEEISLLLHGSEYDGNTKDSAVLTNNTTGIINL